FSLNADIHWPDNAPGSGATSALVLGVLLVGPHTDCNGVPQTTFKIMSYGLRPVLNPLGHGAGAATTRDTFSIDYLANQSTSYQVFVLGPAARYCSVTQNGSGVVNDINYGTPDAYPAVQVSCSQ